MADESEHKPTILARLRDNTLTSAFAWNLSLVASIANIKASNPLRNVSTIPVGVSPDNSDIYTGALTSDSDKKLTADSPGCWRDENGTLVIPYCLDDLEAFSFRQEAEEGNSGERNFQLLTEEAKQRARQKLNEEYPYMADFRFEEVSPEKAAFSIAMADLSEYEGNNGKGNSGAYATQSSYEKRLLVMGSHMDANSDSWSRVFEHEVGHILGKRHGHVVRYRGPNLPKDTRDKNISTMNYPYSTEASRSGQIVTPQNQPKTPMWLDQQWYRAEYGESKLVPEDRKHELKGDLWAGVQTASNASDTLVVSGKGSAILDLESGAENISNVNQTHSWNSDEIEVGIATNDENNILLGGDKDNSLIDSDGSSFVRGKKGNDLIVTGGGNDRIFIGAGDGQDRVTDYDPEHDIIEYGSAIDDYTLTQDGTNVVVSFLDENQEEVASMILENTQVGDVENKGKIEASQNEHIEHYTKYLRNNGFRHSGAGEYDFIFVSGYKSHFYQLDEVTSMTVSSPSKTVIDMGDGVYALTEDEKGSSFDFFQFIEGDITDIEMVTADGSVASITHKNIDELPDTTQASLKKFVDSRFILEAPAVTEEKGGEAKEEEEHTNCTHDHEEEAAFIQPQTTPPPFKPVLDGPAEEEKPRGNDQPKQQKKTGSSQQPEEEKSREEGEMVKRLLRQKMTKARVRHFGVSWQWLLGRREWHFIMVIKKNLKIAIPMNHRKKKAGLSAMRRLSYGYSQEEWRWIWLTRW